MRRIVLFAALAACSALANAAEPCPLAGLVPKVRGMAPMPHPPVVPNERQGEFLAVYLVGLRPGTDMFAFTLLVDVPARQGWVNQFGGFAGVWLWYGPFPVDPALAASCEESPVTLWSVQERKPNEPGQPRL